MGPIEHYLYRVAPLAQGGYISVHIINQYGTLPGKACNSYEQAIYFANWFSERQLDVYLSQGGQKKSGPTKEGKVVPEADRNHANIWCLKSLRMDVDAKLYASITEMDRALDKFYSETNIPRALFAVKSGSGGYHLYWPFNRLVTPDEWQPLADALAKAALQTGLKFDSECTVDSTRVLRIPGTRNYKNKDNPTIVEIYYDDGGEFTYEELQQALSSWVGPLTASSYDDDDDFADEKAMQKGSFAPVDIEQVRKECGLVDRIINTGGAACSQTVWFYTLNLSSHTTDPHKVAHNLSKGYHSYSPTETDQELIRVQKSNKPPVLCKTFQRQPECVECTTCKHRASNSNPISLGYKRINGNAYHSTAFTLFNDLPDTPHKYYRRASDNFICADYADEKNGQPYPHIILTFEIIAGSGRIEGGEIFTLIFTAKKYLYEREIRITGAQLSNTTKAAEAFGNFGFVFDYGKEQKRFLVAFLDKMKQNAKTIITIPAMGWQIKDSEYGFSFNGLWISPTKQLPALRLDADLKYGVAGDDKPWRDLVSVILNSNRLDLLCILAAGFGAPFMGFTGHNGVVIGGYSFESGVGKTTAMSLSQAVWGSSSSMMGLDDTYNAVVDKATKLTNVAMYWDEIKNADQEKYFLDMVSTITGGRSKARARMDGSLRAVKEWELPIIYAANRSMVSAAEQRGGGTAATIARMFELECPTKLPINSNVDHLRTDLKYNYGHMGEKYAVYLGQHRDGIILGVKQIRDMLQQKLAYNENKDRFIFAAATEIIAGAHYAQQSGLVPFNTKRIWSYITEQIQNSRNRVRQSSTDYANDNTVMEILVEYLSYHRATRMVKTDRMRMTPGQPSKGWAKILNGPMPGHPKNFGQISVHISLGADNNPDAPYLRFTQSSVGAWCKTTGKDAASFGGALRRVLGEPKTATVGAGTDLASGSEKCWTIPIRGTILEQALDWPNGDDKSETDSSD